MLTLLCGADRLATSAALLCAVCARAEAGKGGNILIVPEQYSHETERALCRAGGGQRGEERTEDQVSLPCV